MKAYYGHDVVDVTLWITAKLPKYYSVVKPLAYQLLKHEGNLDFIAKNDLISMSISSKINSINALYFIDRKSTLGQLLEEYMQLKGRSYPYWVLVTNEYLLIASPAGDWFSKMLGDEDTDGLEAYGTSRGISIDWNPDNQVSVTAE